MNDRERFLFRQRVRLDRLAAQERREREERAREARQRAEQAGVRYAAARRRADELNRKRLENRDRRVAEQARRRAALEARFTDFVGKPPHR